MQPNFRRYWIGCAVLILTLACAHAAPSDESLNLIGVFSNARYTPEHAYGYSVQLWKSGDAIVGLLSSANGLSGDTPIGQIQNVHWNPTNGSISFVAKLSAASLYLGNGETKPTHDMFAFRGTLVGGKVLAGTLSHKDLIEPSRKPTAEQVRLVRTDGSPDIQATTRKDWQQAADLILRFRGPKW